MDRTKETRCVLAAVAEAGAAVQLAGVAAAKITADAIDAHVAAMQRVRKWATQWRRVTREAGPARVAALRRVRTTADWAIDGAVRAAEQGLCSADEATTWVGAISAWTSAEYVSVRATHPRAGARSAYFLWWLLAKLSRRRLLIVLRRYGRHGVDPALSGCVQAHGAAGALLVEVSGRSELRWLAVRPLRAARTTPNEAGGLALARAGLLDDEQCATARWVDGGAWPGERRRREERRKRYERLRLLAEQARFSDYLSQASGCFDWSTGYSGYAAFGLSGRPLEDVGARWHAEVAARGAGKRRRLHGGRLNDGGAGPAEPDYDRWDRWPVDGPFDVRWVDDGGQQLEARIRWQGHDPTSLLPWPEQWVRERDAHGFVMSPRLRSEARAMERRKFGCRVARAPKRKVEVGERPAGARRSARLMPEDELPIHGPTSGPWRRRVVVDD
jgi:hypothetical protein